MNSRTNSSRIYKRWLAAIALTLFCPLAMLEAGAYEADTLYVHLKKGGMDVYPRELILNDTINGRGALKVTWKNGKTRTYNKWDFDSVTTTGPALPALTSLKFNNKYNDEMPFDVEADISGCNVTADVPSITKWLTPSFKVSDEGVVVTNEDEELLSKESRLRFDHDMVWSVSLPGCQMLAENADGSMDLMPYGRDYTVSIGFLTESAGEVPRIDIDIDGGRTVTSRSTYLHANFHLYGNGVYDDLEDSVWIKGRGNTSWGWPKKPYRLKFDEKVKPFGLTKGKSWVLLSNYQTNSMMTNAIGMKAARLAGAAGANHIIPVDLYINGEYRGSYNFTEKVGISNNSIDIDEETSVLLELDQYYDEKYRFSSSVYALPVNVKDPDLTEEPFKSRAAELYDLYRDDFNNFSKAIYKKDNFEEMMDVEAFARFLMVNDLILNLEICHPKSTYVYKENVGQEGSKYVFGPVWDLDWGFGYENHSSYYQGSSTYKLFGKDGSFGNGTSFFSAIFRNSEQVRKAYYYTWYYFMQNSYQELIDYVQDYCDYANPSFVNNSWLWGDGYNYPHTLANIRSWLDKRTSWMMSTIETFPLDDPANAIGDVTPDPEGCVVHGGDALYIMAPAPRHISVVGANGIQVQSIDVPEGITTLSLEPGIYIVEGKKAIITKNEK